MMVEIGQRPQQSTRHIFKTLSNTKWTLNKWSPKDLKTQKNYTSQAEQPHKCLKNEGTDIHKSIFLAAEKRITLDVEAQSKRIVLIRQTI